MRGLRLHTALAFASFILPIRAESEVSALLSTNQSAAFSVTRQGSAWWLVSPQGKPFFSLGICSAHQGASPESFDPENPGYAAWKQYSSPKLWADATLTRLKDWGFTTLGAWSDLTALRQSPEQTLWLTPVLHMGSTAGAPWWDMWDPQVIKRMDDTAREHIMKVRDDPRLIGYYSDNELGWWNATLWKMTLEQSPASGQRQRLVELLMNTYENDWTRMVQDFTPEHAENWSSLREGGMLYVKPGSKGFKVMRRFIGLMAERYYQLVHDIIRKYDQRALILGDRYQSFYYPEVAKASAPWVDIVSSNLNADWVDGTFLRCYLQTLHELTGKPILISELYAAAMENRTGNRNSQGVFPVLKTQPQRAATLRNTLIRLARTPYVLGADWFQYSDEPRHGREDGENFNFGLVDIFDRPYAEVTASFASFDAAGIKTNSNQPFGNVQLGIPPAPRDPFADFVATHALQGWDRERGFVKAVSPQPLADLYVCWKPGALYIGLCAVDVTEEAFYRARSIAKIDRALWLIRIPGQEPIRIRLGAGREPIANDTSLRIEHLSGVNVAVRSVTAIEIPASKFGKKAFKRGDQVQIDSTFWTHGRCYEMDWKGSYELAK